MIIVEGPDGAGKTTLINRLQNYTGLEVAPRVVSKDAEAMVDLQEWVDINLDQGFQHMIYDRHRLISETIYGPILRAQAEPGFSEMSWLAPRMKRFYDLRPFIIYCLPSIDTIWNNIRDDDDNLVVRGKFKAIHSAYVTRAALDYTQSPGRVKVWDYEKSLQINNQPSWFLELMEYLKFRKAGF